MVLLGGNIDRVEEGLETEVPSKYHPCISAVLIEAYFFNTRAKHE